MYGLPEVAGATAAWWQGLARAFRAEGVAEVPEYLSAQPTLPDHWLQPDLLFSQTCGYPLTHALAGRVRLVATPAYAARGCTGTSYCSLLIVAEDNAAARLEDLRGCRCAFNNPDSQSGYNVLRAMVAPLARGGRFFGATIESGGHRASIAAVASGQADLCAVDGVTHAMLARHAPATLAGTRVLAESPSAPGLPFITAGGAGDDLVERLQAGLARALADPALAAARDDLLIAGTEVLPLSAYDAILEMERAAIGMSYEFSHVTKRVILIGTSHEYQLPGRAGSHDFRAFVERLCFDHHVRAVAEECSQEALQAQDAAHSVCELIAGTLSVDHQYCDPDRRQRIELGILQENDIEILAWWSSDGGVDTDRQLKLSHSKRESYWLDRLLALDRWPALFVCGANHVEGFSHLLVSHGLSVHISESDWSPSK